MFNAAWVAAHAALSDHDAIIEACAAAVAMEDREGRDWIKGSLWDRLTTEAAARVRALKTQQP